MKENSDLASKSCVNNDQSLVRLNETESTRYVAELEQGWFINDAATSLSRRYKLTGFAKPLYLANLAAYHADVQNHHPDVAFGWGYCEIRYTTHKIGGLSVNDFICAAKLDRLMSLD